MHRCWVNYVSYLRGFRDERLGSVRVFQKLFSLRIILCFDLLFINEVFLDAYVTVDLEAVLIERIPVFMGTNVVHGDVKCFRGPLVCLWLPHVRRMRLAAIARILVVVQGGGHVMRLEGCGR